MNIRTLEKHLPEDLVYTICKRSHNMSLQEVHEQLKCDHYIRTFKFALSTKQVIKMKIDLYEWLNMYFYIFKQKNRYLFVGHWRDTLRPNDKQTVILLTARGIPISTSENQSQFTPQLPLAPQQPQIRHLNRLESPFRPPAPEPQTIKILRAYISETSEKQNRLKTCIDTMLSWTMGQPYTTDNTKYSKIYLPHSFCNMARELHFKY